MDIKQIKEATKDLRANEQAFVLEYTSNGGNATQAYLNSFETNDRKVASVNCQRILARQRVKMALDNIQDIKLAKRIESVNITRESQIQKAEHIYVQSKDNPDLFNTALKAVDIQNKTANLYHVENASGANEFTTMIGNLVMNITSQPEQSSSESELVVEAEVVDNS